MARSGLYTEQRPRHFAERAPGLERGSESSYERARPKGLLLPEGMLPEPPSIEPIQVAPLTLQSPTRRERLAEAPRDRQRDPYRVGSRVWSVLQIFAGRSALPLGEMAYEEIIHDRGILRSIGGSSS